MNHRLPFLSLALPLCVVFSRLPDEPAVASRVLVRVDQPGERIAPEIYGHFAEHLGRCVYEGFWVGEASSIPNLRGLRTDVVEALRRIEVPVLRWPGGCFADEYHWRDGVGPRAKRPAMVNTHWGMVTETNEFGTHEFLDLCELLECEAYVAGNVGSGTVEEMQDWVEYMTFAGMSEMADLRRRNGREEPWRVRYFGVGNENWACGGYLTPEFYSDLYRRFSTYVRSYSGNPLRKVACGPGSSDLGWLEVVTELCASRMDAISLHCYVRGEGTWKEMGSATEFEEREWYALMKNTLAVDAVLSESEAILDRFDPERRIGLFVDEYGTWWEVEPGTNKRFLYQQNTLRDALAAGIFLNLFNDHCGRVRMANIAQTNNVLQAMILTRGPEMIVTPTYHVFEMYRAHQGATRLPVEVETPSIRFDDERLPSLSLSASRRESDAIQLTICNLDTRCPSDLTCELSGFRPRRAAGRVLTAEAMNAHNDFEHPDEVLPRALAGVRIEEGAVRALLPPKSVVVLRIE